MARAAPAIRSRWSRFVSNPRTAARRLCGGGAQLSAALLPASTSRSASSDPLRSSWLRRVQPQRLVRSANPCGRTSWGDLEADLYGARHGWLFRRNIGHPSTVIAASGGAAVWGRHPRGGLGRRSRLPRGGPDGQSQGAAPWTSKLASDKRTFLCSPLRIRTL